MSLSRKGTAGFFLIALTGILVLALGLLAFTHRTVYRSFIDPSQTYRVELTYQTYLAFLPMGPGQSGDKPGFVEIFRNENESMGRIPVSMLQLADVRWEKTGAYIPVVGEWDFEKETCYYWNKNQTGRIFTRGRWQTVKITK